MRARSECFLSVSILDGIYVALKPSKDILFVFCLLKVNTVIFFMLLKVVFGKLNLRHHRDAITRTRSVFNNFALELL